MTIKEFYEKAKSMGKENCEMITIKMGKDRKYQRHKIKPRYGKNGDFVYIEIGEVVVNCQFFPANRKST